MNKLRFFSPFATLTTILIVCISAAVVVNGCRKTDKIMQPPVTGNTNNNVEQRFFNEHRSADAAEAALVGFIKRKNEKQHFVATTVSRIGYPRWDKALSFTKPATAGKGNSADSTTITYVPFVRDSQNYVNAAMVIQSDPIDTSFSYNCDWQYAQKQNSLNSYTDTAEYYAVLFMVMDKRVFGHNKFNIIDTNLFYSGTYKTASIALDTTNSLGRNSELVPIENCQPITIYKIVPCSGKTNSQISGCFQELLSVYCWVEYIETGIGSGGDGGATGGEGDGTPGECNSNPTEGNRTAINNTCGPGWEPVPIDDEPPAQTHNPCDTLNKYSQTGNFRALFAFLDSCQQTQTKKENLLIYNDLNLPFSNNNPVHLIIGQENKFSVYPTDETLFNGCWGWFHNHYADEDSAALIFSPGDINIMADLLVRRKNFFQTEDYKRFMIGLVADSNTHYVLMVDDMTQFTTWVNTYKNEELISYVFGSSQLNSTVLPLSIAETEKRFLKAMQFAGLKLFRGSNNLNTWTPLKLDSSGNNVQTTDCL